MRVPSNHDSDDPWVLLPSRVATAQSGSARPALQVEIIEGVEPLDTQIGVFPKKTVPDALYDALFGESALTAAEIKAAGGDSALVPPMQTYAVLDGAKITNLPELLERGDLEHRCLFKGGAYDKLKNVAPWIVRLEDDNVFTRNLFTRSDAGWHMWDNQPGIYVRSRGTLNDIWRHFRKFTRVRDESGKWFYLRFWETEAAEVFWTAHDDHADHLAWRFGKNIATICWPAANGFVSVRRPSDLPSGNAWLPVIDAYRPLFRAARWNRFVRRIGAALGREGHPFDRVSADAVGHICDAARRAGCRSEAAIWDMVRAIILFQASGRDPNAESLDAWRDAEGPDERVAARRLLARARLLQVNTG